MASRYKNSVNLTTQSRVRTKQAYQMDFASEITRILSSCLSDTQFIFTAALTCFVVLTHIDDFSAGPLGEFMKTHADNKLVSWIMLNLEKSFGALVFLPTCMRVPKSLRTPVFVCSLLCILVLPPLHIWSYFAASVGTFFFVNFRTPTYKLLSLGIAGYLVYSDLIKKKLTSAVVPN